VITTKKTSLHEISCYFSCFNINLKRHDETWLCHIIPSC